MREEAAIKSKGIGTNKGKPGSSIIEQLGAVEESCRLLVDGCLILKRVASFRIIPYVCLSS
jgi:hypothetical protein